MYEPEMIDVGGIEVINTKTFFISHSRMGPTVYVGPFYTLEKAQEFSRTHNIGNSIVGMTHPSDAVDCNGNLRQEVWH